MPLSILTPGCGYLYEPYFTVDATKVQQSEITFEGSHSSCGRVSTEARQPDFRVHELTHGIKHHLHSHF